MKEVLQETLHYPVVVNVKAIWKVLEEGNVPLRPRTVTNPTDVVRLDCYRKFKYFPCEACMGFPGSETRMALRRLQYIYFNVYRSIT